MVSAVAMLAVTSTKDKREPYCYMSPHRANLTLQSFTLPDNMPFLHYLNATHGTLASHCKVSHFLTTWLSLCKCHPGWTHIAKFHITSQHGFLALSKCFVTDSVHTVHAVFPRLDTYSIPQPWVTMLRSDSYFPFQLLFHIAIST